jgi:tol-pal system protein YbgF
MTTSMPMLAQRWLRAGAVAAALPAAFCLAQAQQPYPPPRPAPAAKAAPAQPREAAGDAALRQRVEQLEEQLVDIQVVIGTLESLAKGATAPVAAGGRPSTGVAATLSGADAGRLDALETQIRAMAAQLEQMQEQIRALGGRGALTPQAANDYSVPPRAGRAPEPPGADRTGFGAVTVSPDSASGPTDPVPQESPRFGAPVPQESQRFGAPVAAGEAEEASPKQLYETAYGYLLQRDYGAAEAAFDAFLKRHPNDPLAGNAQYWLGESLYVRGQYRAAAGAFLKGYQSYSHSAKAPESLLKLAMSLQRLGQKDAACSSYGELSAKFPNAPPHVKASAQQERQRAGC